MTLDWTPYLLTSTLYAGPAYWIPERQRPLLDWGAQRFDSVQLPSNKGMVFIPRYGAPADLAPAGSISNGAQQKTTRPYALVAWFDLSASDTPSSSLRPGVANRFRMNVDPLHLRNL